MTIGRVLSDIHGNTWSISKQFSQMRKRQELRNIEARDILMPGTDEKVSSDEESLDDYSSGSGELGRKFMAGCSPKIGYKTQSSLLLRQCQHIMEEISLDEIEELRIFHAHPSPSLKSKGGD